MRPWDERHQRMNGSNRCAALPQRLKFAAEQRSAGVKGKADFTFGAGGQGRSGFANRAIRDAQPQQLGIKCRRSHGNRPCARLRRERAGRPERAGRIPGDNLGHEVATLVQRHGQKCRQAPRSNNGHSRLSRHARSISFQLHRMRGHVGREISSARYIVDHA